MKWLISFTVLFAWVNYCVSYKILVLISTPGTSHARLFENLIAELGNRGHEITVYSSFEQPIPHPNVTEIVLPNAMMKVAKKNKVSRSSLRNMPQLISLFAKSGMGKALTETFLEYPQVQELINSDKKFDAVICELFLNEAMVGGFGHKFKAPIIGFGPAMTTMWTDYMVGNPTYYGIYPVFLSEHTTDMTLVQRVINVFYGVFLELWNRAYHIPSQDQVMRKYFGREIPPLSDIIRNMSVLLLNYHHSYSFTRPYVPNMIEVGGIAIKPPQALPQDIQKILDESKNGVIVFSLGSLQKSAQDLSEDKIKVLCDAFSRLEQDVIWKFENDSLDCQPKNVRIFKWIPQSDMLAHPKVKLLIAHGGLGSTAEAVYRGVPLIGMPNHGDQPLNMQLAQAAGYAKVLNSDTVTADSLVETIQEVIDDPKYGATVKKRSEIMKDSPLTALEKAVFWIEYAIRHDGAPHLRSAVQDLAWYEYYLLDVILFLLAVAATVAFIFFQAIRVILKKLIGTNQKPSKNTKKAKKDD